MERTGLSDGIFKDEIKFDDSDVSDVPFRWLEDEPHRSKVVFGTHNLNFHTTIPSARDVTFCQSF